MKGKNKGTRKIYRAFFSTNEAIDGTKLPSDIKNRLKRVLRSEILTKAVLEWSDDLSRHWPWDGGIEINKELRRKIRVRRLSSIRPRTVYDVVYGNDGSGSFPRTSH